MTPGATDTVACVCVGLLDRIAVRSDIANWRMPSPWVIGFGISSAIAVFPVIKVTGNLTIAEILLLFSLVTVAWLIALMIRRAWCERHPYMPPRSLAVARAIMGDDLIDAALERLRDTPPRGHDRVLRRGEMIEAILDEQYARFDARNAATGVRLDAAAPQP
jgi:small-conductance mechanosensitive channel